MFITGPRNALHTYTYVCEEDFYTAVQDFFVFSEKSSDA